MKLVKSGYLTNTLLYFGLSAIILTLVTGCIRPVAPEHTNKKFISSERGELIRSASYIGEPIRYRIYYFNTQKKTTDITITDPIDKNLKDIRILGSGHYDPKTRIARWVIKDVAPGKGGHVEFEAIIKSGKVVRDTAYIHFGKVQDSPLLPPRKPQIKPLPSTRDTVKTNTVETRVCPSPKLGWIPFEETPTANEGALPRATLKEETTMGTMVRFDIPGIYANQLTYKGEKYHKLTIPKLSDGSEIGHPELPVVGQLVEIPLGVDFDIEIVDSKSKKLDCYNAFPKQEPEIYKEEAQAGSFSLNKSVYTRDAFIPTKLATVKAEDIGIMRGHRLVFLKVNPVQYNPVSREALGHSLIEVRLKFKKPAQIHPVDQRLLSDGFEQIMAAALPNYKSPERFNWADDSDPEEKRGWDYLILTHGDFYNANDANNPLVRLRNWKQRKGLKTRIVDIADITDGSTAQGIRKYIQTAYEKWNPAPSYVLLVGDAEFIPTNYVTNHTSHNNTAIGTDIYYSTVDGTSPATGGTDYFPDLFIGRLPVDTLQQAENVINKILAYEQNPPNAANFYTDTSEVCLFEDDTDTSSDPSFVDTCPEDGLEDCGFNIMEVCEPIRTFLNAQGYDAERIYGRSSSTTDPRWYVDGSSLPNDLLPGIVPGTGFQWNGGAADIRNAINNGNFLVHYLGHGFRAGWGAPAFNTGNMPGLTNNNLTPAVLSFTCMSGWFDTETDAADLSSAAGIQSSPANEISLGESFIRAQNSGAVAFIGSSRNSWSQNLYLALGAHKALWPEFQPIDINAFNSGTGTNLDDVLAGYLPRMGQINTFSKIFMANFESHNFGRQAMFEMYHLLGDPEMPLWTARPSALDVTHPEGLGATGTQDFVVKVRNSADNEAVSNARVVLTRNNEIIATNNTNIGGIARFTLNSLGTGNLALTVTHIHHRPYEKDLIVSSSGGELNRLEPDNGIPGHDVLVSGRNFLNSEEIDIELEDNILTTTTANSGEFGQAGGEAILAQIPAESSLGPVNIVAKGKSSNRYAVDVFKIRTNNPVDLYTYNQRDSSTWELHMGDNPTWNNPEIQLYDDGGSPVASNNLNVTENYTIRVKIHNDTAFTAENAKVSFRWANFGVGQSERQWNEIDVVSLDIPAGGAEAGIEWSPPITGHLCLIAEVYHVEDINDKNNYGQENTHVGATSSPVSIPLKLWNPGSETAMVHLELRQQQNDPRSSALWGGWIRQPKPQLIEPGGEREVIVTIDPDIPGGGETKQAEFDLTGYIDDQPIGGVNFMIRQ